jgi:hypothetical protein
MSFTGGRAWMLWRRSSLSSECTGVDGWGLQTLANARMIASAEPRFTLT